MFEVFQRTFECSRIRFTAKLNRSAMRLRRQLRFAVLVILVCNLPLVTHAQSQVQSYSVPESDSDCQLSTAELAHMQIARIVLQNEQQQRIQIEAHIADEPLERAAGYQHICASVIVRTAILFRYRSPKHARFHMRNVKAPLDIGFFAENGVLMQYMVMQPYRHHKQNQSTQTLYGPMRKFQYALEARRGFFQANGLSAGSARLLLETLP